MAEIGTYTIADLLAVAEQSVVEYGLNTVQQVVQDDLNAWNAVVTDAITALASPTTDRQDRHGASNRFTMRKADEFSRGVAEKGIVGSDVAYPLEKFKLNVGWTYDYLKVKTPRDLAQQVIGTQEAHQRAIYTEIQRALYRPTNYTFIDELIDNVSLGVKRLYNADSDPIPSSPYLVEFDGSTHTHYTANATLTEAVLDAAIRTVAEHTQNGKMVIVIAETNIAEVEALAAYEAARGDLIIVGEDQDRPTFTLDGSQTDNRRIGVYRGLYEVWTKPWALANYLAVIDANGPRPLRFREREQSILRGLRLSSTSALEPLIVEYFEAEFGLGVSRRDGAAILQFDNVTYQDPF